MARIALEHGIRCCIFLLPFLVAVQGAQAGSRESKERAAKTACLSGDAAKGVALLAELYVDTNDIIYLFNQGRCFEQNGRYADAIIRFREYQGKNRDAGRSIVGGWHQASRGQPNRIRPKQPWLHLHLKGTRSVVC